MTQKALAERLGVTPMTVYYWERGVNPISQVVALAMKQIECEEKKG